MNLKEQIEIKSFSGIDWKCVTFHFEKESLHIYFQETPEKPSFFTSTYKLLQEASKQNWGKGYTVRFDKMNYGVYDPNKDHLHVYHKNNQLFAINRDGTAHDRSHGKVIPNHVADRMRTDYPDFKIPAGNILESIEGFDLGIQDEILHLLDLQPQYKTEILNE